MPVSVPVAQVQSDELPGAVGKITFVNLLRIVIQLVAIPAANVSRSSTACEAWTCSQVLSPRVTLPTAVMRTLKLLVESLAASAPFSRWSILTVRRVAVISVIIVDIVVVSIRLQVTVT